MTAVALNDRQWTALWALDLTVDGIGHAQLARIIGKYATNTITSLVELGVIEVASFGRNRVAYRLTAAGEERIARMKDARRFVRELAG